MQAIIEQAKKLGKIKREKMYRDILNQRHIKDLILEMNKDQLYELGEDSTGRSLGDYAPTTVEAKKKKGQRYDHITLRDTGTFYDSFKTKVDEDGIVINADGQKDGGSDLLVDFGVDVLGLNDFNMNRLRDVLQTEIVHYILNKL